MAFVIRLTGIDLETNYYSGKTYVYQGQTYPCYAKNIREAKEYVFRGRAESAAYKLDRKIADTCTVEEVEEPEVRVTDKDPDCSR